METKKIRTDAMIFEASGFPIISRIFGVTYPSKPTAVKKAKIHSKSDKNSLVKPLKSEIDDLPADPFDDQLLESFQGYLETSRSLLKKAHNLFSSQPNPSNFAGVAAHLYY